MSKKEWLNEINERIEARRKYEADVEFEMYQRRQKVDDPTDIDFYRCSGYEPEEAAAALIMEKKKCREEVKND